VFAVADDTRDLRTLIAANLRRLRVARELSMGDLARATGLGKATLSELESGRANPTIGTLGVIAGTLRVPVAALLEEPPLGEIRIVRRPRGDAPRERGVDRFEPGGGVDVREISLDAREVREEPADAAGAREEVYVLQGSVIAGPVERITELAAGDFASFPADVPRHYEAGRRAARVLVLAHAGR
jgi:transcriptional regulator with XRE-family HTH domain